MKRHMRIVAVVTVAVIGLTACGDDDDSSGGDDAGRDELIESMVSEGAPRQEAECFVDELGVEDAERIFGSEDDDLSDADIERASEALEACAGAGGGDDSDPADEDAAAASDDGADGGDLSELSACIEGEGPQVESSSVPEDLREAVGIVDAITVVTDDGGTGSVTLYEDMEAAGVAREAESSLENDGVTIGQMNEIVYVYTGSESGIDAIEGCMQMG